MREVRQSIRDLEKKTRIELLERGSTVASFEEGCHKELVPLTLEMEAGRLFIQLDPEGTVSM
jgi:hypothetical protein